MKKILLLLFITSIIFMNCDGRKSHRESLQQAISEFNQKQRPHEIVTFYPKEYTEIVTDTLISNRFEVNIKNYSLMDQAITLKGLKNQTSEKAFQRVFVSEVVVNSNSKAIFKAHINAEQFPLNTHSEFWNNATLEHVWVNQETSTKERVNLEISFLNPLDNTYKIYQMDVDSQGQHHIHLLEETI
ncbi:MAG: hypothetical protein R2812_11915 [Gelidibacter sp.]